MQTRTGCCLEALYLGLKQLQSAYQENRSYDYEITKHISLRQVSLRALLELRELGNCEFALPEVLFDMDFPGHYKRRTKSVSLPVPCVIGSYTSINCTMRLLERRYRVNIPKDKNDYLQKINEPDPNFHSEVIPLDHIAISNGQNDSGVFELDFKDERYTPFVLSAGGNWSSPTDSVNSTTEQSPTLFCMSDTRRFLEEIS